VEEVKVREYCVDHVERAAVLADKRLTHT